MAPSAVSQDTVRLVLVYIGQSLPLPPHLLSKPLLQRHYFLQITPDDYIAYLAWPGSEPELLADVLSGLSLPPDDHAVYTIAYSSDQEITLAHVPVVSADAAYNSLIRLVFMWDNVDATWKYHNLAPMPFPQDSVPSVDQAMSQTSFDQFEIDADSYWDTPDQPDEVGHHDRKSRSDSDDDYWARYSIVQGSGDSVSPSPPQTHERVMISYPATQIETYNPLEPPSPEVLARRLAALSASVMSSQPGDAFKSSSVSPTLPPEYPPYNSLVTDGVDPKPPTAEHPSDVYLGDAIQGIYHLWRVSRPEGDPREAFMDIIRQSIYAQ
ncbi:hypothetical protein AX14_006870 [Amanita brunnescens Koide BX004]|nr:hypothetical protein AX14_006870 [Amanita brunnescens Koide BX004]